MKTLSNKKELIKEDFETFLNEKQLEDYLSLIDDDRFCFFDSSDEDNMIKLKSDKDVIVIPEIAFKVDENSDMTSLLDGYTIAIEVNFSDLIEVYESKHEKIEHVDLVDEFLVYLYSNNEAIDFKGEPQLYDCRQFMSYKVDLKEVDGENHIENLYKNINIWIEYHEKSLNNIYKELPKFEV